MSNGRNLGKDHGLRKVFSEVSGRFVATMDADGENQPEEIPTLLGSILDRNEGVDVIVGSRFNGNLEPGAVSRVHMLGSKCMHVPITRTWRLVGSSETLHVQRWV